MRLGRAKINFASALDFYYICAVFGNPGETDWPFGA